MSRQGDGPIVLETVRRDVVLRELTVEDADAYHAVVDRNRAHLDQRDDHPFERAATLEDVRRYFLEPWDANVRLGVWMERRLVGRVDLNPVDPPIWVLGYWLAEHATGKGVMTVACRAAVAHVRSLGATELYAGVTHGNEASVNVLRRLGFEHLQDLDDRSRWRLALVDNAGPPVMV